MSDLTLRRRIAALVVMAFLSVMGATVASATVADAAHAGRRVNGRIDPPVGLSRSQKQKKPRTNRQERGGEHDADLLREGL